VKRAVAPLLLALVATPALADEVWTTFRGNIVYDSVTADGTAVFTAPAIIFNPEAPKGSVVRMYIPGMDTVPDARYRHMGFWLLEGGTNCTMGLTGPDGVTSTDWGLVEFMFDAPGFPTGFTMSWGYCEFDKFEFLRAIPVVGE
jgi:hypothetical protein